MAAQTSRDLEGAVCVHRSLTVAARVPRREGCSSLAVLDELMIERGVFSAGGDELAVGAALDDAAGFDDQNLVGGHDGAESVGDDEGGAAGEKLIERMLDQHLGGGVDGAG